MSGALRLLVKPFASPVPRLLLTALAAAGLIGCGAAGYNTASTPPVPTATPGVNFVVMVSSAAAPIAGATVQLYAAGSGGNGSQPAALLSAPLTTATNGSVTIPYSAYSCPDSTAQVYLYATGGTVGSASSANSAIALLSAIGTCTSVTTASTFNVNEVTTAAAAYALAPFYSANGAIGASSTNITGLTNALATASELVNPATGAAPGLSLPANVVLDATSTAPAVERINSVANLLHACTSAASACDGIFNAVGDSATNTADAAHALVTHPGAYTADVYKIAAQDNTYTPALIAQPSDYSLFLSFSGAGMNEPTGLGVDSTGSIWVASYFSTASKFTPLGAPVFANGITGDGLNNSYGLALDASDNIWIPNQSPDSVSEISSTGASLAGSSGYTAGGLSFPTSVAIDPNGATWVVDYGNGHLTLLNSSGQPLSGPSGYTTPLFFFPDVVAVDGNHFGWVGNQADTAVIKVAPDGSSFQTFNCCDGAAGIAFDQNNNAWIANYYGDSISMISNAGGIVSNGQYKANGSIDHPLGIAIDGAGQVWVANYRQPYLTELAGATSAAPGTPLSPNTASAPGLGMDASLLEAYAIAVDASGNVWVSNEGSNTITKFVGAATPVKTPRSGLPKLP